MAKGTGLGARLYVGGYDISGDTQALDTVSGSAAMLDTTDITQSAHSRLPGLRDGTMGFTVYFDKTGAHVPLSSLPTSDTIMTFLAPPVALGCAGACLNAKQVNYDPTRSAAGDLTLKTQGQANGYGLEWGVSLTPGLRTDSSATAAGSGNSVDTAASASYGGQAYLQVTAFSGTSVTVSIWDSADNSAFTAVTSFAFTAVTAAPAAQRIAISNTSTIRRYVAVATAGTFSNAVFSVVLNKNVTSGVSF
jgi:hypothetical protein